MGYGKNLKQALDDKGMTVRDLCRQTDISPTTIYSIIQRDSSVRYDFALRIANVCRLFIFSMVFSTFSPPSKSLKFCTSFLFFILLRNQVLLPFR